MDKEDKMFQKALASMRKEYTRGQLTKEDCFLNPMDQFHKWFQEALNSPSIFEPSAMIVSTGFIDGTISSRTVLLKDYHLNSFIFVTNRNSKKAQAIRSNSSVALLFPWLALEKQIHIQGIATEIEHCNIENYFSQRPRGSQISASISQQSSVIESREKLEEEYSNFEKLFENKPIPCPDFWTGYAVNPISIEFWQGRANRLHDRILYRLENNFWSMERLAP